MEYTSKDQLSESMGSEEELEMIKNPDAIIHSDLILSLVNDQNSIDEEWFDESLEERLARKHQTYGLTDEEDNNRMSGNNHTLSGVTSAIPANSSIETHSGYRSENVPDRKSHYSQEKAICIDSSHLYRSPQTASSMLSYAPATEAPESGSRSIRSTLSVKSDVLSHSQSSDAPMRKRYSEDTECKSRVDERQRRQPPQRSVTAPALPTTRPNMTLLRPVVSYSQSSKQISRPADGTNIPGAYVVGGTNMSDIVVHEEYEVPTSEGGNSRDQIPAEESNDDPACEPTVQEAIIEQPLEEEKTSRRKYWYWAIGGFLLILIAIGVGLGVGLSNRNGHATNSDRSITPSPAPISFLPSLTVEVCSLEAIYAECQEQVAGSFASPVPDCAVDQYAYLRTSVLTTIDPTITVETTSCAAENLALLALASNGEESKTKFILNTLYFATNGHNWNFKSYWLSTEHVCDWEGILCFNEEIVVGISLKNNNLSGSIPTVIGLLDPLETFEVTENALRLQIPEELANLERMAVLDLSFNAFERGTIPSFLSKMTLLRKIDLSQTERTGTLSIELLANWKLVQGILMSENGLKGSIPSELFSLPLVILDLKSNEITGSIPTEIGLLSSILSLNLGGNLLNGKLPTEAGQLTSMVNFLFADNNLSGFIPDGVCSLWKDGALELLGDAVCCSSYNFYGGLICPSAECCNNCPEHFEGS